MIFTSTPQTNHDPEPWREVDSYGPRHNKGATHGYYGSRFQPRAQFDGAPANSILLSYRFEVEELGHAYPEDWLPVTNHGYLPDVSDEERDHARRVLERLVALT